MSQTEHQFVETEIKPLVAADDWVGPEPGDERYGPNQMIGSFNAGIKTGFDRIAALADQQFEENRQKAGVLTRSVLEELTSKSFHPEFARLKIASWDEFEVLIALPKKEFLSDALLPLFDFTTELEQRVTDASFSIVFHFFGKGENYNEKKVLSDGYLYSHKSLTE